MTARALWTVDAMASAMGAERQSQLPESVSGLSIDSRSISPGEAFFAIRGDHRDGHEFVAAALSAKAALAVVAAGQRAQFPVDAPLLIVRDVLGALRDLAAAARVSRFLQQSLGRAADARALSRKRPLCCFRNGDEPSGRNRTAVSPGSAGRRDHHHDRAGAS